VNGSLEKEAHVLAELMPRMQDRELKINPQKVSITRLF